MGKKKLLALLMATVLAMQPTISVTAETGQVTDSVGDYEGEETKEKSKVTELENTDSAVPNSPAVDEEMTKMTSAENSGISKIPVISLMARSRRFITPPSIRASMRKSYQLRCCAINGNRTGSGQ